jgi:hypothetical protein
MQFKYIQIHGNKQTSRELLNSIKEMGGKELKE